MNLLLRIVLVTLILGHIVFCAMEWNWLDLPKFQEILGFDGPQDEVAIVGKNQAFSNLILACGLAFGWIACRRNAASGRGFVAFFLIGIALAGLVGFSTMKKGEFGFLLVQTLPASIALALLWFEKRSANNDSQQIRGVSP
jgi:uncharacterized membrane protein